MNIINVSNLKKAYGTNVVLKGLDFQAQEGEVIGVIGKNGAGKSTFLEILMTIKQYDAGTVFVFDEDIKALSINRNGTSSKTNFRRPAAYTVLSDTESARVTAVI